VGVGVIVGVGGMAVFVGNGVEVAVAVGSGVEIRPQPEISSKEIPINNSNDFKFRDTASPMCAF